MRVSHALLAMRARLALILTTRGRPLRRLWSARLIHDGPEIVQRVHTDFLTAGADIIGTACKPRRRRSA